MGDVAMTVPVLKALVQQYPEIRVTVLTRSFFKAFFKDIPNVMVFSPELKGKHKGFLGIRKLSKELSTLDIDLVADLHNVLRSNLLIRFLKLKGIPYKQINKGRADKKALTRASNKIFKPLLSTHHRYENVFSEIGYPLDLAKVNLLEDRIDHHDFLNDFKGKKLIGIAPFAAHKGKMLPLEKTRILVNKLSKEKDLSILLFGGGKEEKSELEEIAKLNDNVYSLVGKFSFKEELQIISGLDLMVSMDSGNGHIAAMYGVPVITIWGVTHPYAGFTPFNQPEENQILPNLDLYPLIPTSVYGNKYPEAYITCFDTIEVNSIIEKIRKRLK